MLLEADDAAHGCATEPIAAGLDALGPSGYRSANDRPSDHAACGNPYQAIPQVRGQANGRGAKEHYHDQVL